MLEGEVSPLPPLSNSEFGIRNCKGTQGTLFGIDSAFWNRASKGGTGVHTAQLAHGRKPKCAVSAAGPSWVYGESGISEEVDDQVCGHDDADDESDGAQKGYLTHLRREIEGEQQGGIDKNSHGEDGGGALGM